MHKDFRALLEKSRGSSELVIAVNLDIRGFSEFSKTVDPLESALYLKKVYIKILDEYFSGYSFFKPTGDGLLIIIPYTEDNLSEVIRSTVKACLKVLIDFGSFCSSDTIINFNVPEKIGIGLSRGSACRLYSDDKTLDYCGSVLNLSSRLMDLARPLGIVFDGRFGIELIPEGITKIVKKDSVYLKGIAEKEPIDVYYTKNVRIPNLNKQPLQETKWGRLEDTRKFKQIKDLAPEFEYDLPSRPIDPEKIKIKIEHPLSVKGRKRGGLIDSYYFDNFEYSSEAGTYVVQVNFDALSKRLAEKGVKDNWDVDIIISYTEE